MKTKPKTPLKNPPVAIVLTELIFNVTRSILLMDMEMRSGKRDGRDGRLLEIINNLHIKNREAFKKLNKIEKSNNV